MLRATADVQVFLASADGEWPARFGNGMAAACRARESERKQMVAECTETAAYGLACQRLFVVRFDRLAGKKPAERGASIGLAQAANDGHDLCDTVVTQVQDDGTRRGVGLRLSRFSLRGRTIR